ncbi:XRE family transcriptional regulator [Saccharopolyspora hirsuta]|uniref:Helix-turn-helix domain-containing protein n=1 Tax=Saccharopolyspora hirsuta TaxID=1837 RepID=A0A5M7C6V6_SACHI|nr:XRE family transcriptional regulator [Saccharopolyspora hirsuta]KAA5837180.1 helix-turn-helix domain-containing protein [Saccharopolyspora hirsuta]
MKWRTWDELREELDARIGLTPEQAEHDLRELEAYYNGYRLAELRKKVGLTQTELAERMGIGQPRVSAIERGDIESHTVATLRSYVEALGGTIQLSAHFDGEDTDLDVGLLFPKNAA